jgi:phage repressor protein C with HTH and peptisase S24 domain
LKENLHFSKRLKSLIDARGISPYKLGKEIGVSHVAIGNWLEGQVPKSKYLDALARFFGVSMGWLLTGEDAKSELKLREAGGPYWGTSDEAPVVSPVAAGTSHAWIDRGHDAPRVKVNCKDPNCYAVEVWGDSMAPIYQPGDILVIAPNAQIVTNDLVVFKTEDDEPYFKKYLGEKNGVYRFASLNPNYPIMEFRKGEVKAHAVHSIIRPLKGKIF